MGLLRPLHGSTIGLHRDRKNAHPGDPYMIIKTWQRETRVKMDPTSDCVSIRFPGKKNWLLFVSNEDGRVSWFNEKTEELIEIGKVPLG